MLDHFAKRFDWTSSTEITVARPIILFQHSKHTKPQLQPSENKHLDGGLTVISSSFSPKKQTHKPNNSTSCS